MKVRKAVIPAAGFDTRMLPLTSIMPKELLPVNGRPIIEYVVREAVAAGIEEVILVISEGKESLVEYFRPNRKLEAQLLTKHGHEALRLLEEIWNMVKITPVYQHEQKGLGHALLCAKNAVGNEPFAVLLGDSIIQTDDCHSFTKQLVNEFHRHGRSVVGLKPVEECLIHRYGIFEGTELANDVFCGTKVMEKPSEDQTNSNLAFCARYVLGPAIFQHLEKTTSGINSESQLTDAMQSLLDSEGLNGVKLQGEWLDIGDPKGLLLANLSIMEFGCEP
jgi:UTP--glucose-1-phosphate uridylyltransferase